MKTINLQKFKRCVHIKWFTLDFIPAVHKNNHKKKKVIGISKPFSYSKHCNKPCFKHMTTDAIFGLNQFETSLKPLANKKKRKQLS